MKRSPFLTLILLLVFSLSLFALFSLSAAAEEETNDALPEEFSDLLEALPEDIASLMPEGLFSQNGEDVSDAVTRMSDFSYLLQSVLSVAGVKLSECLRILTAVAGILILSAVLRVLRTSFPSSGIGNALSFCTSLVIILGLVTLTTDSLEGLEAYFKGLSSLTAASVPLLGALYAMGGNPGGAAASSAGLSVYLAVVENLVGNTVLPFCGLCMALALLCAWDPALRLGALLTTLKKNYTTLLAFLMMLLLAMLGAQTVLAVRNDTLIMRSVKFAAGNLIPVVGGSVAELLRSVRAGVGYLRGIAGVSGILLLLYYLLPTVIELFFLRLTWQLAASLADLLGCSDEKKLLDEFASLLGFLISAAAICSSVPVLAFSLLAGTGAALG